MKVRSTRVVAGLLGLLALAWGLPPPVSARPAAEEQLHPVSESDTSGCLWEESPEAHCDVFTGRKEGEVLMVESEASTRPADDEPGASTRSAVDDTGFLQSGRAVAAGRFRLYYETIARGNPSTMTVSVQLSDIEADLALNSPTTNGYVDVVVRVWPLKEPSAAQSQREQLTAPLSESQDSETVVLEFHDPDGVRGRVGISVQLSAIAQVGWFTCPDPECFEPGSGVVTARGSLQVDSVTVNSSR